MSDGIDRNASDTLDPALRIRMGSKQGASLRVKALGLKVVHKEAGIVEAIVPSFREAAVATSGLSSPTAPRKTNRCIIIIPSEEENSVEWNGLFVKGRFSIRKKEWDPRSAREMFKVFTPE